MANNKAVINNHTKSLIGDLDLFNNANKFSTVNSE